MARIDSLMRRALGVAHEGARVGGMVIGGALGRVRTSAAKPDRDNASGSPAKRTTAPTRPRTGRKRTTAQPPRVKAAGESIPDELAARRKGRQGAPTGSQDQGGGHGGRTPEAIPPAERAAGSSAPPSEDGGTGAA